MTPCRHGYSGPHIARDFTDPKDPLGNRVDGTGNPYLGDGYASPCPGPLVQTFHDEQVAAWGIFDEDDSCRICGAQVREFSQILHYCWHQNQGQDVETT